jgi:hypothetical protein
MTAQLTGHDFRLTLLCYMVGGPWITVRISTSTSLTIYVSRSFPIQFSFTDVLDQIVNSTTACAAKFEMVSSTPQDVLQPVPMYQTISQGGQYSSILEEFGYFQVLEAIPFPNASVQVVMRSIVQSIVSNPLNLSVKTCETGSIVTSNFDLIYACIPCISGTFLSYSNGQYATCDECPTGRYSLVASTSCDLCPHGSVVDRSGAGQGQCFYCSEGRYSNSLGGTECLSCILNTFSEGPGNSACKMCPSGSITNNNASYSKYQCVCPEGMYGTPWNLDSEFPCRSCYVSMATRCEVNSSIPFVEPTFWRNPMMPTITYKCFPSTACLETEFNLTTTCNVGYTGYRCGACEPSTHFHFDAYCKKCGDLQVSLPSILCLMLILGVFIFSRIYKRRNIKAYDFSVIIYTLQILAFYPRISTSWPPALTAFLNGVSISVRNLFALDFRSLTSLSEF